MVDPAEESDEGEYQENDPEHRRVNIKKARQTAADAGYAGVLHVAVKLFLRLLFRSGTLGLFLLYLFRATKYVHYLLDGGQCDDSVRRCPFEQEFGHPLFDTFDDLGIGIVCRHILQISGYCLRGLFFKGESVSPYADSFYLFHPLSVSIARTISCQALSMSLSCSRPLSVMQ